jgi:hypothetical protein
MITNDFVVKVIFKGFMYQYSGMASVYTKSFLVLLILLAIGAAALACGCLDAGTGPEAAITASGTVTYIDLEGGFYGIVASDGARYLPLNLPAEFREDGLSVSFEAEPEEDVATIQQWGTPVTLLSIEGGGHSWP